MKANRLALAVVAAACTLSAPAFATTISLDAVKSDTYVNGQGYTGTFDGKSVLPASYTVNSISFTFDFKDNNDAFTTGPTRYAGTKVENEYSLTSSSTKKGYTTNIFDRDLTINNTVSVTGQQESVSVSLGGVVVGSGSTSAKSGTSTSTTSPVRTLEDTTSLGHYSLCLPFVGCFGWVEDGKNQYYDNTKTSTVTTTQDWTGSFSVSGTTTDQQLIQQLLNTSTLQFGLDVKGDLYLTAANVTLDITQTAVPEPSTIALALAGLAGLGYTRRKGKRA